MKIRFFNKETGETAPDNEFFFIDAICDVYMATGLWEEQDFVIELAEEIGWEILQDENK